MRTIYLSSVFTLFFGSVLFSQTSTPSAAQPQDDLCTAINKLMEMGIKDGFESIKTGEKKAIPGKVFTDFYWQALYSANGFTEARIKKTVTGLNFYTMVYFRDKDANAALEKYKELIAKVKECIPKANCTFAESQGTDLPDMKRFEFWTLKAKAGFSPMLEKYYVTVNYLIETESKDAVVFVKVSLKE